MEGMPVSFAYGVRQGRGAEVEKLLGEVDSQMYVNKAQNLADDVSHPEPSGGYFRWRPGLIKSKITEKGRPFFWNGRPFWSVKE